MKFRFFFLSFFFISIYGLLVFKLYSLQISQGDFFIARAESQRLASSDLQAPRGSIYFTDSDGLFIPAALDKTFTEIYAVPTEITDPAASAAALAPLLGFDVDYLTSLFSKSGDQYELLVKKASPEQIVAVSSFQGIYQTERSYRFYPLESLSSHLLGFVSEDASGSIAGRYGLERQFEDRLAGVNGAVKGDRVRRAVPGLDLYLTIDRNIQFQAEKILSYLVDNYRAAGGSVLVQDPHSGRLLALANLPAFNPNSYYNYPLKNFLNPAVESIYEPGSIFKIITMAIGLDTGAITPITEYLDTGSVTLNGRTIKNWDLSAHGRQTMTGVLEHSINTGTVFAEQLIGHGPFLNYLHRFGFNELTNISLPGEVAGSLAPLEKNPQDINFATASFGQGISVTPIGLLRAISAIAAGGEIMKPILEASELPESAGRVLSKSAAREVTQMMVSAVDSAVLAAIPGYTVAGKTGTAQVPDFKNGGYTKDVINTYAGFAPASDPRFVILIKLDKPAGAPLAGQTVVPAFKELAQFILNYYHIPPDRL